MVETKTFAVLLRHHRIRQGLSLGALAQRAGLTKTTLSNWEAGRTRPGAPELESLLQALAIPSNEQLVLRHLIGRSRTLSTIPLSERPPLTGGLLRALRLRNGQTQSEVAQALGIRQGTLAKWEASEDWPTTERLAALCTHLRALPEETEAILSGIFFPLPLSLQAPWEQLCTQTEHLLEESSLQPNHPLLDLRYLELEALLHLESDSPAAQELLWRVRAQHLTYLCLQGRYDEALAYAHPLLEVPFDPRKASSSPFQVAVIQKAKILQGPANMPFALRQRRAQAALSFLRTREQDMGLPECQAWYWMSLAGLLIVAGLPDEAQSCIERSNAIPHPDCARLETPEASLVTAGHRIELGEVDAGLTLLEAPAVDLALSRIPILRLRRTILQAKALVRLWDVAGADAELQAAYQQQEELGATWLRPEVDSLALQLIHLP